MESENRMREGGRVVGSGGGAGRARQIKIERCWREGGRERWRERCDGEAWRDGAGRRRAEDDDPS